MFTRQHHYLVYESVESCNTLGTLCFYRYTLLMQSGVEPSSNAKCMKNMQDNTNPKPVSTSESQLILLENAIITYLETCLLRTYTLINAYFLPL